jgi:anti-anti-sigma factor
VTPVEKQNDRPGFLHIDVRPAEPALNPPAAIVAVAGEIDVSNAEQFRHALLSAARLLPEADGVVVIDLADVTFLDSTALSALVFARSRHGGLVWNLCAVQGHIKRLFALTGLDAVFPGYADRQTALTSIGRPDRD